MIFSSMYFLWLFLPAVLFLYFIVDKRFKNILLFLASLFFYACGEPYHVWLMIASIAVNYSLGILVNAYREQWGKRLILLTVVLNLSFLFYFKYTNFFVNSIKIFFPKTFDDFVQIALPIGISFYTFQAMSYVIDVYRKVCPVQKNPLSLGLFITFFPQLIAGPIIKYHEISRQIANRQCRLMDFSYGIRRFIFGLSKKVLIANTLAITADHIFTTQPACLGTAAAWLGAICYTFQIYYDFSGYSDMAIGLGRMFGFHFPENFCYPYMTRSIKEFWSRWHISLSTWFKEYLYIPLGGNRRGTLRTYGNLFIVFLATGIWHGANWTFLFWGIYHGCFISLERFCLKRFFEKNKLVLFSHIYALLTVICGWVLFRADNIGHACSFLKAMFLFKEGQFPWETTADIRTWIALIFAVILCGPLQMRFPLLKKNFFDDSMFPLWDIFLLPVLLILCIVLLFVNTYNPFIYFRF